MNLIKLLAQIDIDPSDLSNLPKTGNPNNNTVNNILSIVFGVAGGVALIVIVVAGIMFMLSRGDPQKAAKARATIIYAGVGLAVAMAAFGIVRLVVTLL